MIQRFSKVILGIVAATLMAASAGAAMAPAPDPQAKQKAVKDQGEFDVYDAASKATDLQKKLDLLKQWEQKYPDSDFKNDRTLAILNTYSQIMAKVLQGATQPEVIDASVKAAQVLLDGLDKFFAAELKPDQLDAAAWAKARKDTETQAHYVLGFVAFSRKVEPEAEKEFATVLNLSPEFAMVSYFYGNTIARQKKKERLPEALYHVARAVSITGPTALDPKTKETADTYLKKAYDGYHGSDEGLAELRKLVTTSAMPPAGFKIRSIVEIEEEKAGNLEEFLKQHPDIKFWRQISDALKAPDGPAYFEKLKGAAVPPEGQGFTMFKGKVISQPSPKELLVNVESESGDVTLKLVDLQLKPVEPGTKIEFKGVVDAYTKEPYMLTFLISEKEELGGGITPEMFGAAAAAKKPAVKKPVAKKPAVKK